MKNKSLIVVGAAFAIAGCTSTQQPPLVYNAENTGAALPKIEYVNPDQLPQCAGLPDPFAWADGSGRSTKFADWERRRNEIKSEIEFYEIGAKPENWNQSPLTKSWVDQVMADVQFYKANGMK